MTPERGSWQPPSALTWIVLLVVYIGLGLWTKATVLNWTIGPLFPLIVLFVIPTLLDRLRSFGGAERSAEPT